MSVDSVNWIFKGVLNLIRKTDVAEMLALRLNCRIRFRTPLSDKAVRKRRFGGHGRIWTDRNELRRRKPMNTGFSARCRGDITTTLQSAAMRQLG